MEDCRDSALENEVVSPELGKKQVARTGEKIRHSGLDVQFTYRKVVRRV